MRLLATLLIIMLFLVSCDGGPGIQGTKGPKGPMGPPGIDLNRQLPDNRYLCVAIVNGSMPAVTASRTIYVSFDSTQIPRSDTVAATQIPNPPLIDGFDGGASEWGVKSSKLQLLPTWNGSDLSLHDPRIYSVNCKVTFDESCIYTMLQWKELTVEVSDSHGRDTLIVNAGESDRENHIFVNASLPDTVVRQDSHGNIHIDTTFNYLRFHYRVFPRTLCLPPPPLPPIVCETVYDTLIDTTFVWKSQRGHEDRAVVYWSANGSPDLRLLASDAMNRATLQVNPLFQQVFVDSWQWGLSTTQPSFTADDWCMKDGLLKPDQGDSPWIDNWLLPDSVPRLQHLVDPNRLTVKNYYGIIDPLWIYETTPYQPIGWALKSQVFVPGVVVSIPSQSRGDIYARARFADQVWTLELKRSRNTGSNDDLQF